MCGQQPPPAVPRNSRPDPTSDREDRTIRRLAATAECRLARRVPFHNSITPPFAASATHSHARASRASDEQSDRGARNRGNAPRDSRHTDRPDARTVALHPHTAARPRMHTRNAHKNTTTKHHIIQQRKKQATPLRLPGRQKDDSSTQIVTSGRSVRAWRDDGSRSSRDQPSKACWPSLLLLTPTRRGARHIRARVAVALSPREPCASAAPRPASPLPVSATVSFSTSHATI